MNKVIYRIYPDGKVIALFPQLAVNVGGWLCQSYMHIGQHSGATPFLVVKRTRLATSREFAELHAELKRIGYNPQPAMKCTEKDFEIRKAQYT